MNDILSTFSSKLSMEVDVKTVSIVLWSKGIAPMSTGVSSGSFGLLGLPVSIQGDIGRKL